MSTGRVQGRLLISGMDSVEFLIKKWNGHPGLMVVNGLLEADPKEGRMPEIVIREIATAIPSLPVVAIPAIALMVRADGVAMESGMAIPTEVTTGEATAPPEAVAIIGGKMVAATVMGLPELTAAMMAGRLTGEVTMAAGRLTGEVMMIAGEAGRIMAATAGTGRNRTAIAGAGRNRMEIVGIAMSPMVTGMNRMATAGIATIREVAATDRVTTGGAMAEEITEEEIMAEEIMAEEMAAGQIIERMMPAVAGVPVTKRETGRRFPAEGNRWISPIAS